MRPVLALLFGAVATMGVVGCTLLVSFDDVPNRGTGDDDDDAVDSGRPKPNTSSSGSSSSGDTTSSSSSGGDTSSSSSSSSSSSGAATYPPACDAALAAQVDCAGNTTFVCGNELPNLPAGVTGTDLVECGADGTAACVRKCTMGCSANGGRPAQCGNCLDTKDPDVWYCGKDIGWVAESRDFAVHCVNGQVESVGFCGANLCHTKCTRTSPPPLPGSCCQSTEEP